MTGSVAATGARATVASPERTKSTMRLQDSVVLSAVSRLLNARPRRATTYKKNFISFLLLELYHTF